MKPYSTFRLTVQNPCLSTYRKRFPWPWNQVANFSLLILMALFPVSFAFAEDHRVDVGERVIDRAKEAWLNGAFTPALDILDQGIRENPHSLPLQKLRGDILATTRRHQEAVDTYEAVLQGTPNALGIRWAKWSVLTLMGKRDQAVVEFQRITRQDANNPLVHLRLAQELRKLDRLEESLLSYQKAVDLAPEFPGWRLALARARFDVLDYIGARDEVKRVLKMVTPESPEEAAARSLLSIVYGATKERGRRFQPIFSPDGSASEKKQWALIRNTAWELFTAGRYEEAELVLREVLSLHPNDYQATHDLGITLMELGRYEEALTYLQKVIELGPSDEDYVDTTFRIGQTLMKLEQWPEALLHFELLHDMAVEFEESTKGIPIKAGNIVIDKEKVDQWLDQARQHVPSAKIPEVDFNETIPAPAPSNPPPPSEQEIASKKLKPDKPTHTQASLMGRDADFSMFRFVIPAGKVMRDDLLTGAHEFIPIEPGDTFPTTQQEIHLVFGLVTPSFDEVPLIAECFLETSKITGEQTAIARDNVVMSMNEQSGYFVLSAPESGWTPGLHRCGLFVGNEVSAYTHADEVRFRIIEQTEMS